jgi:hypothetical protein
MLISIPTSRVQTGDLAHCTSASFVANMIRLREVNWQFWRMFDLSVATHTAIVVDFTDCGVRRVGLMEMIPNGQKKSALQFTPFSNYLNQGNGGDRIISIARHMAMIDTRTHDKFMSELLTLWEHGTPYDDSGCLKNAFSFLKDVKNDYYCSELAEHCADIGGFSYYRDKPNPNDNVMPVTLQRSKFMNVVLI